MRMLRGSCLCEAVRYEVEDAFHVAFYCHCARCRRATGSAFKPMAALPSGKIRLTQGQGEVLIFGAPPDTHDIHCGRCGSFLYSVIAENGNAHVAMGSLIDAPSIRPMFHMFVGSKADWHEITDELPQYEEFPG